jgi:uncharacterized repeat protein (TIGR02543 family)
MPPIVPAFPVFGASPSSLDFFSVKCNIRRVFNLFIFLAERHVMKPRSNPPWIRGISALAGILLSLPLMAAETITVDLRYDAGLLSLTDSSLGVVPELKGCDNFASDQPGAPLLPAQMVNVVVPAGAKITGVTIAGAERMVAEGVAIAPVQPPVIPGQASPAVPADAAIYGQASAWPADRLVNGVVSTMRGVDFYSVLVRPVRYVPSEGKLLMAEQITLTISHDGSNLPANSRSVASRNSRRLIDGLRNLVANPSAIDAISPVSNQGQDGDGQVPAGVCDLLIITNDTLAATAANYAAYRAITHGVTYEVKTVSAIASSYSRTKPNGGVDDQTAIRRCIQDYVANHDTLYVVLIGDNTVVPDRDCYVSCSSYTCSDMPTDLYYAGINDGAHADIWDIDADGVYGEADYSGYSDEGDLVPDVILGRIPVRTTTELTNYLTKVQTYEAATHDSGYTRKIIFTGTLLWGAYTTFIDVFNDGLASVVSRSASDAEIWLRRSYKDYFQANGFRGKPAHFLVDSVTSWDGATPGDYVMSDTNLNTQINGNDYFFLHMNTHGGTDLWAMESGYYSPADMSGLSTVVPVVTTMACLSGGFDQGEPSLSEGFIRDTDGGSIIFHGCSRYGWGTGSYTGGYGGTSANLCNNFYQQILVDGDHCVGKAFLDNKIWNAPSCGSNSSSRWIQFGVNLQGDPLYTIPQELFVTAPDGGTLYGGTTTSIAWTINDGNGDNVQIDLHKAGAFLRPLVASTSHDGAYDWILPADLANASDYTIKVSDLDNPTVDYGVSEPFSICTYTVTYGANGATSGAAPGPQVKVPAVSLVLAANTGSLAKTGNSFAGWNTAADGSGTDYAMGSTYTDNASLTLYAKWTLNTYAVTYNANGATSGTAPNAQVKTYGVDLTLAANTGSLARTGFSFDGWNTAADGSGTSYAAGGTYTANAPATLFATWTPNPYAVTYDANEATSGTAPDAQVKTHGVNLTLATNTGSLARTGFSFVGWNTAANGSGTSYAEGATYTANANLTLYAKWTALPTYDVIFVALEGGTVEGAARLTQTVFEGEDCTPVTATADADYSFSHWSGSMVNTDNPLTVTNVTSDLTLFANFAAAEKVACGLLFPVSADEANVPAGLFSKAPKVWAVYHDPIKDPFRVKPKKAAAKVATKILKDLPVASVNVEWKRKVRLYDAKAFKGEQKSGTGVVAWLKAHRVEDLNMVLQAAGKEDKVAYVDGVRTVALACPRLDQVLDPTDLSELTDPADLPPGGQILLKGRWFGVKPPKVWLEYRDAEDAIKLLNLKAVKPFTFDVKGKVGVSVMDVDDGASEMLVQLPEELPAGIAAVVIENGVGLACVELAAP